MPGFTQLLVTAAVIAVVWLWWGNTATREKALEYARNACLKAGVQLLDQTVSLRRYRLLRDRSGRLTLARLFTFEYSVDGDERRQAFATFVGGQLHEIKLDRYIG